jgi:hypothetical protein
MNFVKNFSRFIGESIAGSRRLAQLGLTSRNEKLIKDVEQIIELCPNLSYVTYPEKGSTAFSVSKQVSMPNHEIDKAHIIMRRLEDDEKMPPELRAKLRTLGDRYRFKERLKLVVDIAKEEYGEEFLNDLDTYFQSMVADNFRKMIQDLKEIDSDGNADLYIWDIGGWDLSYTYFYGAKEGDRYNSGKILEMLKENPEDSKKVSKLSITAKKDNSKEASDFARRMSSGEYGPLD